MKNSVDNKHVDIQDLNSDFGGFGFVRYCDSYSQCRLIHCFPNSHSPHGNRNCAITGNLYLILNYFHTFQGIFRLFSLVFESLTVGDVTHVPIARPARLPGSACALPSYQPLRQPRCWLQPQSSLGHRGWQSKPHCPPATLGQSTGIGDSALHQLELSI